MSPWVDDDGYFWYEELLIEYGIGREKCSIKSSLVTRIRVILRGFHM